MTIARNNPTKLKRRPAWRRNPSRLGLRCGVSMLEVLVSVIILGILAAVAVPSFLHSLASHRTKQAARRIITDLELARREATMASAARTVTFDDAAESYTLSNVEHPDHPGQPYTVVLLDAPYQVEIQTVDLGGDGVLVFDGYGQADSGGTIVVQSGALAVTIVVDAATGQASIP